MLLENICAYDHAPSFSSVLLDHWRRFDAAETGRALSALISKHPECNSVRIHHSYDAYLRDRDGYLRDWETLLCLCKERGLGVIPVLFNRWHHQRFDCGGIYLENLIPGSSWAYKEGFYAPFLADICARHAHDERIVLWESCDKPFGTWNASAFENGEARLYEARWLREIYCYIKQTGAQAPTGISIRPEPEPSQLSILESCCDVLLFSPFYKAPDKTKALLACEPPICSLPVITIYTDDSDMEGSL